MSCPTLCSHQRHTGKGIDVRHDGLLQQRDNVDRFSNIIAAKFAKDNDVPAVAGSDSHMLSTLGEWVNTIESENNLDTIPQVT
jgi:PHP-associated